MLVIMETEAEEVMLPLLLPVAAAAALKVVLQVWKACSGLKEPSSE